MVLHIAQGGVTSQSGYRSQNSSPLSVHLLSTQDGSSQRLRVQEFLGSQETMAEHPALSARPEAGDTEGDVSGALNKRNRQTTLAVARSRDRATDLAKATEQVA